MISSQSIANSLTSSSSRRAVSAAAAAGVAAAANAFLAGCCSLRCCCALLRAKAAAHVWLEGERRESFFCEIEKANERKKNVFIRRSTSLKNHKILSSKPDSPYPTAGHPPKALFSFHHHLCRIKMSSLMRLLSHRSSATTEGGGGNNDNSNAATGFASSSTPRTGSSFPASPSINDFSMGTAADIAEWGTWAPVSGGRGRGFGGALGEERF